MILHSSGPRGGGFNKFPDRGGKSIETFQVSLQFVFISVCVCVWPGVASFVALCGTLNCVLLAYKHSVYVIYNYVVT